MAYQEFLIMSNEVVVGSNNNSIKLQSILWRWYLFLLEAKCFLSLAEMDSEELEKELDSLLQDSAKEPVHLHPVPQKDSGFAGAISDAELEAELEKLSVCDGGMDVSRLCWLPISRISYRG